jgi:hypothetical protein
MSNNFKLNNKDGLNKINHFIKNLIHQYQTFIVKDKINIMKMSLTARKPITKA